jgi:hypothetical protein
MHRNLQKELWTDTQSQKLYLLLIILKESASEAVT